MFTKTAVLFFGLLALVSSQSTPVSRCVVASGELPLNTYIENCPSTPCQLPQLQDVVLNIVFQAPTATFKKSIYPNYIKQITEHFFDTAHRKAKVAHTMRSMRTIAVAYLFGIVPVPYDLAENGITCNFLTNTYCPLMQNEVVQYTLKMHIESFFPLGTQATVEFRIEDENSTTVFCVRLPIAIVAPLPASTNGTINAGGQ